MKTIGITGRSGCGKSTVSSFLRAQGYPLADTDAIAREIMDPGSPCLTQLAEIFGADILNADGTLRRRLLADRAFATPEGTKTLTNVTHPEILRRTLALQKAAKEAGHSLFFMDGAVLVGSIFESYCDALVLVTAPFDVSVARICARDGISPEMAARRLNAQMPESVLCAKADYILENTQTPEYLKQQTQTLLAQLRKE